MLLYSVVVIALCVVIVSPVNSSLIREPVVVVPCPKPKTGVRRVIVAVKIIKSMAGLVMLIGLSRATGVFLSLYILYHM